MKDRFLIVDKDAEWFARELRASFRGVEFIAASDPASAMARAAGAQVLIGLAPALPASLIAAMPRLAWVHALTTGVDNLLAMPELGIEVALSSSRGIHGPQMSELAILLMLSLGRRLPQMLANQSAQVWQRWPQPLLAGKTACLVGLGAIAEALAARLHAFGVTVTGVSDGRGEVTGFARIFPRARLREAAAEADFLVVIVPYAPQTHHLVNDAVLAAMPARAFLINISRGGCVDEAALLRHLATGSIAGAGLDVFATEPLPPGHPIWSAPNVIITPHVGGMSDTYAAQALPVLARNIAAFLAGGVNALPDRVARPAESPRQ
jgi:phosphoglycerate dehydrogenase-like enzyme